MTLVAVWPLQQGTTTELVVASDSRLTGGFTFESGPKLFPLCRGDAVLAFAGDTAFAYPLIVQLMRYVEDFDRAHSRAQDICDLAGHCERICTGLIREVIRASHPIPDGIDLTSDFTVVLAGYSWRYRRYKVWTSLVRENGDFVFSRPLRRLHGAVFVGSGEREALQRLGRLRPSKRRETRKRQVLTWEPFDILRDIIRESADHSIGGAPQLVKIYQHMNHMAYAVPWPTGGSSRLTLLGRPLLNYERTQRLSFDPDSHEIFRLWDYLAPPGRKLRAGAELLPNSGLHQPRPSRSPPKPPRSPRSPPRAPSRSLRSERRIIADGPASSSSTRTVM